MTDAALPLTVLHALSLAEILALIVLAVRVVELGWSVETLTQTVRALTEVISSCEHYRQSEAFYDDLNRRKEGAEVWLSGEQQ